MIDEQVRMPRTATLVAALSVLAACSEAAPPDPASPSPAPPAVDAVVRAPQGPPVAPVRETRDVYFGKEIVDPYRWMESDTPEFAVWMKAQAAYTRGELDKLAPLAALRARVKELDNAAPSVGMATRAGGKVFYLKADVGNDTRKLYARDALTGPERLLVDPDKLAEPGKHASIDYFRPSRDGRHVAFGVSQSGSEMSVLHVVETATARPLPDTIDRARSAHPSWLDGKSFFYRRGRKLSPDTPASERLNRGRVYLHELGKDPESDVVVFGYDVSPSIPMKDDAFPNVVATAGPFLIAVIEHGVQSEASLYVARTSELRGDKTPWKPIVTPSDEVTDYAVHGDELYLLSHKGAPRFKLLRVKLPQADLAKATVVVPESERVIDSVGAAADGVYLHALDAGIGRALRVGYEANAKVEEVLVPNASAATISTEPQTPGAILLASSWTAANTTYAFDPKTKKIEDTGISPRSPVSFTDVVAEEVKATSADGTKVPLSILHKKDLLRNGANPTWLRGYGSYGNVWDPWFEPMNFAWLERGGVIGICHPRGGGEYGDAWHRGGQLATKPNTIADFLACAHYLIDEKITVPAHLGGEGTSAGGILIGGAITAEPALFGAAVIRVGMNNALRFEQIPIGPFNTSEFGTVKTEDGFRALVAIDAFHRVKDRTAYPAVLVTTGITDARVSPWQSAKMAARLQAASSSGKPVLLRVDFETGHGIGSSRSQQEEDRADELAFLFTELGVR